MRIKKYKLTEIPSGIEEKYKDLLYCDYFVTTLHPTIIYRKLPDILLSISDTGVTAHSVRYITPETTVYRVHLNSLSLEFNFIEGRTDTCAD